MRTFIGKEVLKTALTTATTAAALPLGNEILPTFIGDPARIVMRNTALIAMAFAAIASAAVSLLVIYKDKRKDLGDLSVAAETRLANFAIFFVATLLIGGSANALAALFTGASASRVAELAFVGNCILLGVYAIGAAIYAFRTHKCDVGDPEATRLLNTGASDLAAAAPGDTSAPPPHVHHHAQGASYQPPA